jgi:hypothetical protein
MKAAQAATVKAAAAASNGVGRGKYRPDEGRGSGSKNHRTEHEFLDLPQPCATGVSAGILFQWICKREILPIKQPILVKPT